MKKLQLKKEVVATMSKEMMAGVVGGQQTADCPTGYDGCIVIRSVKCDTQVCPVSIHLTGQCSI